MPFPVLTRKYPENDHHASRKSLGDFAQMGSIFKGKSIYDGGLTNTTSERELIEPHVFKQNKSQLGMHRGLLRMASQNKITKAKNYKFI